MRLPHSAALLAGVSTLLALPTALGAERVQVVASFSILADMVENVGGEHVEVTPLVGPDSDAHVYSPRPADARLLAEADLVVFNGRQFEGWMQRLVDSSDYAGPLVIATEGIDEIEDRHEAHDQAHEAHGDDHGKHDHHDGKHEAHGHEYHNHGHGQDHTDHGHEGHDGHDHGTEDPHGWQDLTVGKVYVDNILEGLVEADPANEAAYRDNAQRYINEIEATDKEIRELLGEIPPDTSVITGHDSFGYFAEAYELRFLSPMGLSTEAEASAANMAQLIDVIREENVQALFHENMTSPAIINQLAEETGLPVAGTLYADALASEGEASTWLGMMRHNAQVLHDALAEPGHDDHGQDDHDEHGH